MYQLRGSVCWDKYGGSYKSLMSKKRTVLCFNNVSAYETDNITRTLVSATGIPCLTPVTCGREVLQSRKHRSEIPWR
jgi:hypothetical protein